MTIRSLVRVTAFGVALLGVANVQAAGDAAAGKVKANTCLGCHSVPSITNAYPTYHVPKVAGQHADYIVAALKGYKDGSRSHKTMHANSATLSDQDMADIAAYFAAAGN
ncbi:MAG: c-type cytochrome [Chromatiales bacterium]|nr:c-type cytochrome [Zoogloeaceae bacterium]MCP5352386.1 c-type cytochrome [Chromatiales bacterium]